MKREPTKFTDKKIENLCEIKSFISKDKFKIGYVVSRNIHIAERIILICPGLTGFAIPFIEWFWELYNTQEVALVAIDWRGFGLSQYMPVNEGNICQSVYSGYNITTFAFDIQNLIKKTSNRFKKLYLLGHSHGLLCIWQYFSLFGMESVSGLIHLDQSLMNLKQRYATDTSYPLKPTFSWKQIENWVKNYQYKVNKKFPLVESSLKEQFKIPGFAGSRKELTEWMSYTNNINGNALAFIFKDDMSQDLTYVVNNLKNHGKIPVFIYVGMGSLVPPDTQLWIYSQLKSIPGTEKMVVSANNGGYHTPFLPSSKVKPNLMYRLKEFINKNIFILE